jgi:hypothetical protein
MKIWELDELVEYMKKERVHKVKLGNLEVELSPIAFQEYLPETTVPLQGDEAMPTEDEFLYRSSPYYDQMKTQREEGL